MLYYTILYYTELYCTALSCTKMHCIAVHCTAVSISLLLFGKTENHLPFLSHFSFPEVPKLILTLFFKASTEPFYYVLLQYCYSALAQPTGEE